jgi:hypothetical protein
VRDRRIVRHLPILYEDSPPLLVFADHFFIDVDCGDKPCIMVNPNEAKKLLGDDAVPGLKYEARIHAARPGCQFNPLLQLALLAGPSIDAAGKRLLFFEVGLAVDAQADARQGLAAGLGDFGFAHLAIPVAGPDRQPAASQLDGVCHAGIDLILNRSVRGPSTGHCGLLFDFGRATSRCPDSCQTG